MVPDADPDEPEEPDPLLPDVDEPDEPDELDDGVWLSCWMADGTVLDPAPWRCGS